MKNKIMHTLLPALLVVLGLTACGQEAVPTSGQNVVAETPSIAPSDTLIDETSAPVIQETDAPVVETPSLEPADYLTVKPYEVGQTMILMYHGIVESRNPDDPYQRTREEFRNDLQALYDRGYRLLPLKDLVANNVTTAAGYTPVVITFDDGLASSFSLEMRDGALAPVPGCGLDIMMEFTAENPDFGMAATFFINGDNNPFRGEGTLAERLQFLVEHGCDVGNHTYEHADLYTLTAAEIQAQMAKVDRMIREALPGSEPVGVSYPYGKRPESEALRPLVLSGESEGWAYEYDFGLRVGQSGGASTPNRVGFDAPNLPRVRGSHGDVMDLWWMLEQYDEFPSRRYISDGDPNTIVVPREYEENVAKETLGEKELVLYDLE